MYTLYGTQLSTTHMRISAVLASVTVNFLGPILDHPSHFLSRDKCSFPGLISESEVWGSKTCNFIEMCGVVTSSMRSTGQLTVHAFLTWDPISWSTTQCSH